MIRVKEEDLDKISETFYYLLKGKKPKPIALPDNLPQDEFRQAVGYINTFLNGYNIAIDLGYSLSNGDLEFEAAKAQTPLLHSLKSLQASLRTLTWTTQQIANGDFTHQVTFMGDFSDAFNRMTQQLKDSFKEREEANITLQDRVDKLARTRRAMLNIMKDIDDAKNTAEKALNIISSSITYASNIQKAILPDDHLFEQRFSDHFILWKPRDIVGGDIYWSMPWQNGLLVALGDCTGHGVPGAFMTLITTSALARAKSETEQIDIPRMVQRMHQVVQKGLNQHKQGGTSDDGIELGLCYFNADMTELRYVGTRFPLFIVENGQVTVIKGDKKAVGYRSVPFDQTYTEQRIELRPGQKIYLTTDGLIDQVGGPKRRSYGKKRFKTLLLSLEDIPFSEHGKQIYEDMVAYQGKEMRRDDVSVIGFKVNPTPVAEMVTGTSEFESLLMLNCRELDEDHKMLYKMVRELKQSLQNQEGNQAAVMMLKELVSYTQWHFRHEERLMRANAFPGTTEHKNEHQYLIGQAQKILDQLDDPEKGGSLATDPTGFLEEWLKNHILGLDRKLAGFLNNLTHFPKAGPRSKAPEQSLEILADQDFDALLTLKCPEIDEDHRTLYRMVKQLEACIERGEGEAAAMDIIGELVSYTQWHFRHEERLMLACRYLETAAHKKEHEALLGQVVKLQDDLNAPETGTRIALDLAAFLQDWLKTHILGTDRELALFLNNIAPGPAQGEQPPAPKTHKRRWSDANREFDTLLVLKCPELDEDHRKLYQMVKQLEGAITRGDGEAAAIKIIRELASYTQWHFRHEERLMFANHYPELDEHKKEHEDLLAQVNEIQSSFGTDAPDPISLDLTAFLHEWVQTHILECDHKLAIFLNSLEKEFLAEEENTPDRKPSGGEKAEGPLFFRLDEKLKLGFDAIDKEHEEMVDILNQFHCFLSTERRQKAILQRFNYLAEYIAWHIANEERLMDSCRYPESESHKNEHKTLMTRIEAIRNDYRNGDLAAPEKMNREVKLFFSRHFAGPDQRLVEFLISD